MTSVGCHYASLAELDAHELRTADRWLSPAERQRWERLRNAERRATWLGGRVLAKRMLIARLAETNESTATEAVQIHVESRSTDGEHGERPSIFVSGRPLDWALSIAHTARGVLVALGCEPGVTLGVDLACASDVRDRLNWTFTAAERCWLASGNGRRPEQLWAMKEALYKACQQGEGFAPGRIEVVGEVCYPGLDSERVVRRLQCWRVDGQVAALAVVERVGAAREVGDGEREVRPPHPAHDHRFAAVP